MKLANAAEFYQYLGRKGLEGPDPLLLSGQTHGNRFYDRDQISMTPTSGSYVDKVLFDRVGSVGAIGFANGAAVGSEKFADGFDLASSQSLSTDSSTQIVGLRTTMDCLDAETIRSV
mgnify:CR=1 FL=1